MNDTVKKPLSLAGFTGMLKPGAKADADIDLNKVYAVSQVRTVFENIDALAQSIKDDGMIQPIVVLAEADGRYRILVGERRYRAAVLLGMAKVPAIIKKDLTAVQVRSIQVKENNDRENLTPWDEAQGVIADIAAYGVPTAMKIWNHNESWLSKRNTTRNYSDGLQALLREGTVTDLEVLNHLHQLNEMGCAAIVEHHVATGDLSRASSKLALEAMKQKAKQDAEKAANNSDNFGLNAQQSPVWTKPMGNHVNTFTVADSSLTPPAQQEKSEQPPHTPNNQVSVKVTEPVDKQAQLRKLAVMTWAGDMAATELGSLKSVSDELGIDEAAHEELLWVSLSSLISPLLDAMDETKAKGLVARLGALVAAKGVAGLHNAAVSVKS